MTTLLDASALLALVNEESGADKVEKVLGEAAVSTINLAEVASKLTDRNWLPDDIAPLFQHLQLEVLPFEIDTALMTGQLRSPTKALGLSLADRVCLATGLLSKYPVLTADKVWMKVKIRGLKIDCIR